MDKQLEQNSVAPEGSVQEQPKVTFDYGVIERSRFYVTTDQDFYNGMKKNPNFIPLITPSDFKESLGILLDCQLYIFRVSQE